ncbi:MAG: GLUG motif-containing protein, partial [Clostridia bacterium]
MERKNRIFKSFSTALIAIMMFTAMMPSWAYGETAGSGAAVQTAEQQAAQSTASAPVIKNDISEQKASYAVGDTAKALTVTASSDDGGELSYQWQKSADDEEFADIDDADGAEYVPPTDKAGLSYYRVIVTSVVGKGTASEVSASATSSAAAVTVKDSTAVKSPARSAESAVPEGDGTKTAPYRLATADDLMWFAEQVNKTAKKSTSALCAVLTADIDLTGRDWTPIGTATNTYSDYIAYGGVFDGNGKTISGLSIDNTKKYQAFIGYAKGAEVKALTISGSLKTSDQYAAGIVAYGNPVTITDCTNAVTVSSAKYAAGIAASAGTGTVISGCRNTAPVSAAGDYLGGIVATATGTTEIKNCFNSADITNSGKPGGYSYCTGGIAGSVASNSVISMCGNTGEITSTIKGTGGIAGRITGTVEKCFNTGDVTGIYETGGILGASSGKTTTVESCYNTGNVSGTAPTATFNDTNAKGIGGIIGGVSSNSNKAAVLDCYNAGTVTDSTGVSGVTAGGVIGTSIGKNYSGAETKGLVSADNTYY